MKTIHEDDNMLVQLHADGGLVVINKHSRGAAIRVNHEEGAMYVTSHTSRHTSRGTEMSIYLYKNTPALVIR